MGESIVTERDAPTAEEATHPVGDAVRPYRPGSRLRRALDIARESHRPPGEGAAREAEARRPTAATAVGDASPAAPPRPADAGRPAEETSPAAARPRRRGLGRGLDALLPRDERAAEAPPETWETSVQGWVQGEDGLEWRTIVTTTDRVEHWEVGTHLGVVTGRALTPDGGDAAEAENGMRRALARMTEAATARGAHAVLGVSVSLASLSDGTVVTAVGSAVTLQNRPERA